MAYGLSADTDHNDSFEGTWTNRPIVVMDIISTMGTSWTDCNCSGTYARGANHPIYCSIDSNAN